MSLMSSTSHCCHWEVWCQSVCISSSFVGDLSSLWQLRSFYFWSSAFPLQMSIIIDSFQFILLDIYCPSCVYWFISFISFGKFSAFNLITWLDMLDFSMFSVLLTSLYIFFSFLCTFSIIPYLCLFYFTNSLFVTNYLTPVQVFISKSSILFLKKSTW